MSLLRINECFFKLELGTKEQSRFVALYNSMNMDVIYINRKLYEHYKNNLNDKNGEIINSDIFDILKSRNVFVPFEYRNENIFREMQSSLSVIKPSTLRLQLTDNCNLKCSYCQIEKNYFNNLGLNMSKEIAIRSLKLFNKFAPPDIQKSIILTGGEPLLNFEVINEVFKFAMDNFLSYRFILFTNGTCVTHDIAEVLKENHVLVLVSIDGEADQHNICRYDSAGEGSFNDAINGYMMCKNIGCNVGISGVVNNHNIEQLENEILDFFISIKPHSIGMNFPHYLLHSDNSQLIPMTRYADAVISVYKKLRSHGIYFENLHRLIEPFVTQKINAKECAALGRGITVLPDGSVGVCKTLLVAKKMGSHISEIEKVNSLDENEEFKNWSCRSTYSLKGCRECIGLSICGTGCTYDSYVENGNICEVDKRTCIYVKRMINFLVSDLFHYLNQTSKFEDCDIYIPSAHERKNIYSNVKLSSQDLRRSAGHEI